MLDKGEYIKNLYSNYNKNKLAQITDPRTGKLLPTNDPRAQSFLREAFPGSSPRGNRVKPYSVEEVKQQQYKVDLGYPTAVSDESNMFKNKYDFPQEAANLGVEGLFKDQKLTPKAQEWLGLAASKYGMDPAVLGYYKGSSWGNKKNENKTLADFDPSVLVASERYSKQPIISVGEFGDQLTWAPRKGDVMPNKNVADYEGTPRVVGTNMSGVDIPKEKKKKETGGFTETCKEGEYWNSTIGACVNIEKETAELKNQFKPLNDYLMSKVTDPRTGKLLPPTDENRITGRYWLKNKDNEDLRDIGKKVGTPATALGSFNPNNPWNSERFTRDIQYPWGQVGQKDDRGKIITQEQEDKRKIVWGKHKQNFEKLGFDPALIGYISQDFKQPAGLMDPGSLVTGERYTKQPIISVGKPGEQVTFAPRKGEIMTKKNVADEEGQPRVVGATNMSGVDIPKKKNKKKLGGAKCYTCVGRKRRV